MLAAGQHHTWRRRAWRADDWNKARYMLPAMTERAGTGEVIEVLDGMSRIEFMVRLANRPSHARYHYHRTKNLDGTSATMCQRPRKGPLRQAGQRGQTTPSTATGSRPCKARSEPVLYAFRTDRIVE